MRKQVYGPWPDVATARLFLGGLVRGDAGQVDWARLLAAEGLAAWLIRAEIAGLALGRYGAEWAELRQGLLGDHFLAVGEWQLHTQTLGDLGRVLAEAGVTAVLLKGAALATTVYGERAWRTMSDIDLWVAEGQMAAAVQAVVDLGFGVFSKEERPWQLQRLSQGEVQLYRTDRAQGLVELHWSPFPGWWLQRVARPEPEAVWARKERLPMAEGAFYQLAAEDAVIQIGLHLAVSHQFGMKAVQGVVDIALTAEVRGVDWEGVAERARRWRVATAVYTVLHLLDELVGVEGVEVALRGLRPSRLRRWLIGRFVSPEKVLAGQDVRGGRARYALLLLLVDRPRDMLTLIFRTLWPEEAWLAARYGTQAVSRWRHLWQVVRYGRV